MTLAKSSWQTPPTNHKILKVRGTRQQQAVASRNAGKLYLHSEQIAETNIAELEVQACTIPESYQPSLAKTNFAMALSANSQSLITWGEEHSYEPIQKDLLSKNNPDVAEIFQASFDQVWGSDETLNINNLFDDLPTINCDEMMMVDPRYIEGGMEVENFEVVEVTDDPPAPEVFDLLNFVVSSTVGTEDQIFKSLIDDPDLFVQDEADQVCIVTAQQAEIVENQKAMQGEAIPNTDSMNLLSTVEVGDLDLLSAVNSGQMSLLKAVSDDQFLADLFNEPALPATLQQEKNEQVVKEPAKQAMTSLQGIAWLPAKKSRGRPRVPRTSSLKHQPR